MKSTNTHPWQTVPIEIFSFALNNFRHSDEINRRISFIMFDIGIETLFKTYLTLPDGVTKTALSYTERKKYANGQFHDLVIGIKRAAAHIKINETDLDHVEFYHGIRNNLYHQGNGITIYQDHAKGYAITSITLLKQLLEVDLGHFCETDSLTKHEEILSIDILMNMRKEFIQEIDRLRDLTKLFIEKIEPKLIYPSTIKKLNDISTNIDLTTFPSKLEEFRTLLENNLNNSEMKSWLLDFISDSIYGDTPQILSNTQFIMELGKDPISFYLFLIGFFHLPIDDITIDVLDKREDISFIYSGDYHIVGIYDSSCFLLDFSLSEQYIQKFIPNDNIKRYQEILLTLKGLIIKMEKLVKT